jgi:hypothetical protein
MLALIISVSLIVLIYTVLMVRDLYNGHKTMREYERRRANGEDVELLWFW